MPDAVESPQRSKNVAFRVRGLTCSKCVGVALDEIRSLPEVEQVGVRLVPFGVSLITIPAAGSPDPADVRAAILRAGFRVVSTGPMVRASVDPLEFGWEASA